MRRKAHFLPTISHGGILLFLPFFGGKTREIGWFVKVIFFNCVLGVALYGSWCMCWSHTKLPSPGSTRSCGKVLAMHAKCKKIILGKKETLLENLEKFPQTESKSFTLIASLNLNGRNKEGMVKEGELTIFYFIKFIDSFHKNWSKKKSQRKRRTISGRLKINGYGLYKWI